MPWFAFWSNALTRPTNKPRRSGRRLTSLELLEARDTPASMHPTHLFSLPVGKITPQASSAPTGLTPSQVRHAYGFDQVQFGNGVAADGSGTTIAIVDAYDNPRIENDLHQFNLAYGLPDPVFRKVNQTGGSTFPAADAGWAGEIALDVEWAHAMAPGAAILLVEANSSSDQDIFAAVAFAARQPGVVAVSMSFGSSEYSGQTAFDSVFRTPTGHGGVTFIASSGDSGAPASYPSASPNVLSVGGTTLGLGASGAITSETGWSGSGGGVSAYEALPSYQRGTVPATVTQRATPDVSYNSDPYSGYSVYDSFNNPSSSPWEQFGGTSAAAPQWASIVAIADQGRALAGLGSLDGATQALPAIYSLPTADFRDIVSGTSTGTPRYSAGPGYDLVTGRGSPVANAVITDLSGTTTTTPTPPTNPTPTPPPSPVARGFTITVSPNPVTAGANLQVTVKAVDSSGNIATGYTGSVAFRSTDTLASLPASYTFTAADNGTHVFTLTLKTAGSQLVSVLDRANLLGAVTQVGVTAAAPTQLILDRVPANGQTGATLTPAPRLFLADAYGNRAITDNSDVVTVSLGQNATGGILSGGTQATATGGVVEFPGLSIDLAGTYTLVFTPAAGITPVTSGPINISVPGAPRTLVDFENPSTWNIVGGKGGQPTASRSASAAHDGAMGLVDTGGEDWIYRNDPGVQVRRGDTLSAWLRFAGNADGRAYLGFGAGPLGTLSLVAAANTSQLQFQLNPRFGFVTLASANVQYAADHWYRLEVVWGATGKLTGNIYDTDGSTLIQSVSAVSRFVTSGGIALRATGSDKHWDTITATASSQSGTGGNPQESRGRAELANAMGDPNQHENQRRKR